MAEFLNIYFVLEGQGDQEIKIAFYWSRFEGILEHKRKFWQDHS